ncbi:MFS transporter [Pararhizobium arenae]|uniref:MFS transporter n=1 Tax=Pararhizobium arenae TaxID=1856850 RepID=UPI00094AF9E1|nr:MFS transporter [Pararhizobium arenae]
MANSAPRSIVFLVIASGTVLGVAGVDLILPSVPYLPQALGGTVIEAQYVLAAYTLGTAIGLLSFGALGDRVERNFLFSASLTLFACVSFIASFASDLWMLVLLRAFQGAFGAAPAVFAPGLLRTIYGDREAPRVLGWLGSIESLAPALAPIAGLFLFQLGGWRLAFVTMAAAATVATIASVILLPKPATHQRSGGGSYFALLRTPLFLRYALSQALSLGSIMIFVFGAPTAFTQGMGLPMTSFILMQVVGVSFFILGTVVSPRLTKRYGAERVIWGGTATVAGTFLAIFIVSSLGVGALTFIIPLFALNGIGFGIRGPVGFHRAIVAADGDDSRAAAMVVLTFLGVAAAGTAVAAPSLMQGVAPLAGLAAVVSAGALAALRIGSSNRLAL